MDRKDIATTILQMGPMHDLCIGEPSEAQPGYMDRKSPFCGLALEL